MIYRYSKKECEINRFTKEFYESNTHALVAGRTGSGKSNLLNTLICDLMTSKAPFECQFIFIDLKRVEMAQYKGSPYTLRIATEPKQVVDTLKYAVDTIERRYKTLERKHLRKWDGCRIYIVIDELADLMTTLKAEVTPYIQRIAQIGRAANVFLIVATQVINAEIIPTKIKANLATRFCTGTQTALESRMILNEKGGEELPHYGQTLILSPKRQSVYKAIVDYISDSEIDSRVRYAKKHKPLFFNPQEMIYR